jgi:DNA polymerase III subunit gamma/tau
MGQALYRSNRPKKLSEVVGQEHITQALERALAKGTISHAYLFTGPRGVGKTSIARILAHEINGLPYDDDSIHLDIIEIDAASNRRIDEIRDLRDKVHIAPTSAKYKVYIIDEVHMLTKEAFNALLKTLEEPPEHAVFILATTETHKLPETIISRTQRFAFKPVDLPKVVEHLRGIAKKEKIDISDQALELIAEHGEGSFRDSISLLDQIRNTGDKVGIAEVQAMLGMAPKELLENIWQALASHDPVAVATVMQQLRAGGHEPSQVAKQLGALARERLVAKQGLDLPVALSLLAKLLEVPASSDPHSYLEIALLDAALAGAPAKPNAPKVMQEPVQAKPAVTIEPHPSSLRRSEPKVGSAASLPASSGSGDRSRAVNSPASLGSRQEVSGSASAESPEPEDASRSSEVTTGRTPQAEALDPSVWPTILAAIKAKHNTLYSIVRTTQPHFEPGQVTLECGFAFHQKRLNEKRNKEVLANVIEAATGQTLRISCTVGDPVVPDTPAGPPPLPPADEQVYTVAAATPIPEAEVKPKSTTPEVETISNIFGGAELLES